MTVALMYVVGRDDETAVEPSKTLDSTVWLTDHDGFGWPSFDRVDCTHADRQTDTSEAFG